MDLSSYAYLWLALAGVVGLFAFRRLRRVYADKPDVAAVLLVVLLALLVSWNVALLALTAIVVLSFMRALMRQANTRHG